MTKNLRRPRWLTAVVGATLALAVTGAPAVAGEPDGQTPPVECQAGWCPETLPADPLPLGISELAAVHGGETWAVGHARGSAPLALRWDGRSWQATTPPKAEQVDLNGVAGWSKNDVWAVGTRGDLSTGTHTHVQHWDGREWTVVPSPSPSPGPAVSRDQLHAVAVAGPHDVWAVGEIDNLGPGNRPLLLHWDGRAWSVVPTPLSDLPGAFRTVTVRSPHDVWVGALVGDDLRTRVPVTLRWDGRSWQRIDVPDPDPASTIGMGADLNGQPLLVVSKTVGKYRDHSRVWHWTGTAWSRLSVPVVDGENLALASMTADRTGRVWLAGRTGGGAGMVVTWDGTRWTSTLLGFGGRGSVNGLAASPSGKEVWAGGSFRAGGRGRGVIFAQR